MSERRHNFIRTVETFPWPYCQGLHTCIFDGLDARIRILNPQANGYWHAYETCGVDEQVRGRFRMNDT